MVTSYPPQIREAIQLHSAGQRQKARDCLRDFLLQAPGNVDALLWLARISLDREEAMSAAALALKLDPGNETAQRAVIALRKQSQAAAEQCDEQPAELRTTIALATGLTLAQARSVTWPFRGISRPIGDVLDDKTITVRDLAWAAESADSARVRQAARTILLTRLTGAQPTEPQSALHVILGSRYSEWQERRSLGLLAMLLGGSIVLWIATMVWLITVLVLRFAYQLAVPVWTLFVPLVGLVLIWVSFRLVERFEDEADAYRQGRWGEEQVVECLRIALDSNWTLFRNFEWPNRRWGDVDLILIGPGGIWVLEVKSYSGQIRNVGDHWEKKQHHRWRPLTIHPGHQARRNAARLREYLQNHGVDVSWVNPAVVWAGDKASLTIDDPATPVWRLDDLASGQELLWQGKELSEQVIQHVINILGQMAQTKGRVKP